MRYSVKVDSCTTGTSPNTYRTIVGLKMANTAGNIGRLARVVIGGAGVAAQDLQVSFKFDRTGNTTDGTATSVNVATIFAHEPDSVASMVNAINKSYSAEPTTFLGDAGGGGSLNTRGTVVLEWPPGTGPKWGSNQTLCLLACMGTGATAATLDVSLEWDE